MKSYIILNIKLRTAANNQFEKAYEHYRYLKTMGNITNHKNMHEAEDKPREIYQVRYEAKL